MANALSANDGCAREKCRAAIRPFKLNSRGALESAAPTRSRGGPFATL